MRDPHPIQRIAYHTPHVIFGYTIAHALGRVMRKTLGLYWGGCGFKLETIERLNDRKTNKRLGVEYKILLPVKNGKSYWGYSWLWWAVSRILLIKTV